jgi:RND family efflux transporter MFP subunit
MKRPLVTEALSAAVVGVLGLALSGCQENALTAPELPPTIVTVSKPISREIVDFYEFTGQTAAVEEVEIRSRVTGYLQKVAFVDGADVKKGDLLFEIDPRPFQAELDRAAAQVTLREATLKFREAELARNRELVEKAAIARTEFDQSVAAEAEARAAMGAAKAAAEVDRLNLEFTRITSPIDGRISRTRITVGNLVSADSTALTSLVSEHPMYVYFNIDERTLLDSQQAAGRSGADARAEHVKDWKIPVFISLANETGYPRKGLLDFADNKVDPGTGTIRVRAVFENTDHALGPGLFVRVRMPASNLYTAILVTERALGSDQGQKFVYVVDEKNEVLYRPVKVGTLNDGLRVIREGVSAGELVIINGVQRVRPGVKVDPKPGEMAVPAPRSAEAQKPVEKGKSVEDRKNEK